MIQTKDRLDLYMIEKVIQLHTYISKETHLDMSAMMQEWTRPHKPSVLYFRFNLATLFPFNVLFIYILQYNSQIEILLIWIDHTCFSEKLLVEVQVLVCHILVPIRWHSYLRIKIYNVHSIHDMTGTKSQWVLYQFSIGWIPVSVTGNYLDRC